jgi:CRISPR/Cas system-associated exonuclease Cas4 (RecB family)
LINRVANTIHEYVQEIYNFTETEKTLVSDKYKVKGRVDAINDSFLYELKTIDEKKFTGMYIKEHYLQPIIYAYLLNSEYGYNIKTITIVYFFRDNLKRRPVSFDLPLDDKVAISLLNQAVVLHDCISKTIIPEPINANEEQCRWCPYVNFCEKDESKIQRPFYKKYNKKELDIDLNTDSKKEAVFLL